MQKSILSIFQQASSHALGVSKNDQFVKTASRRNQKNWFDAEKTWDTVPSFSTFQPHIKTPPKTESFCPGRRLLVLRLLNAAR